MDWSYVANLLQSGAGNLGAYLGAHVLLCLVPAFFIAGGLSALVPKETVTRLLGRTAPKIIAYPAATLAGSVLAVCSCTILPLFAGIYKKGAGLGPAITFLFFAPAANILALAYTGAALGADFALGRLVLSLLFGIGIGLIMALMFRKDDEANAEASDECYAGDDKLRRGTVLFLVSLVALLIVGTLKVSVLTHTYVEFALPIAGLDRLQDTLFRLVPFDAAKGEEGITAQGAILIGLLAVIAPVAWRGLGRASEGRNPWTWTAMVLIALTLIFAAVKIEPTKGALAIDLTGRVFGVALMMAVLLLLGKRYISREEIQQWFEETWRFMQKIFPLLVVGVFAVGVIRCFLRPEWVQTIAGRNSLAGNLAGVVFGVFMYFPTLVEVPVAKMFLSLGMHRGPLIAYLMADPELSLQSILITASIIGRTKAWVYVAWVALFSTISGLTYGAWVDGTAGWLLVVYLLAVVGVLSMGLYWMTSRRQNEKTLPEAKPLLNTEK